MEENKETKPAVTEQEVMRVNYENKMLKQRLQEAYTTIQTLSDNRGIERLNFLFLIAKNEHEVFNAELVQKAVEEIEETMYPKEETEEKKDE